MNAQAFNLPPSSRLLLASLLAATIFITPGALAIPATAQEQEQEQEQETQAEALATTAARAPDQPIIDAYRSSSQGYSSDEIVINDELRTAWLAAVDPQWRLHGDDWQTQTLLRLLSLRKAGKLPANTSKRGKPADDSVIPIAEIAVRSVLDQHPVSSDELLCDPRLRQEVQTAAEKIMTDIDAYAVRKAALRLRKTRKLRPELVLRVTDWDRTVETYSLEELEAALRKPGGLGTQAGIYLFRDSTGYLYIGEAANLHQRLHQHLHESDRMALRSYLDKVASGTVVIELHRFGKSSPANQLAIRRAYESELIRSREPRFNVRP